jgi:hypothetical protein
MKYLKKCKDKMKKFSYNELDQFIKELSNIFKDKEVSPKKIDKSFRDSKIANLTSQCLGKIEILFEKERTELQYKIKEIEEHQQEQFNTLYALTLTV